MGRYRQPAPDFRFSPGPNRASEINWHPWEDSAFARAQKENRLVFLAIGAFWCHWCHVMDETTYSDPMIIELLNTRFVPVRVDTDQRPDVNRQYNQGGWPSYAILSPSGEILVGGTYLVPSALEKLLTQVLDYYTNHEGEIRQKIEDVQQKRARLETVPAPTGDLTELVIGNVLELIRNAHDPTYGGFDRAPKFPRVDVLDFLLENYYRTRDRTWLEMVTSTLDHMMDGGLFDRVAGGFFRYSTTRDWSVPHYEKMLEDNAQLTSLYLKASRITGKKAYQQVARRTLEYLSSTLLDKATGCFYGSQDAEEEYYLLPPDERAGRTAPFVDAMIYTEWNALAAGAYLDAYRVCGDTEFLQRAQHVLDFLWASCRHEGHGMYHYWDGRPNLAGLLPDQLHTATGMLATYEVTGKAIYLQRAEKLAEVMRRDFYDEVGGGFFDTALQEISGVVGRLARRDKAIDDNAVAADFFLALHVLTGQNDYHELAEQALTTFLNEYQQYGLFAASYARIVDHFLHEPVKVTVVGRRRQAGTKRLLRECLKTYAPATVVELLDPERDRRRLDALGLATGPTPAVYICHRQTCSAPVGQAEDVASVLSALA